VKIKDRFAMFNDFIRRNVVWVLLMTVVFFMIFAVIPSARRAEEHTQRIQAHQEKQTELILEQGKKIETLARQNNELERQNNCILSLFVTWTRTMTPISEAERQKCTAINQPPPPQNPQTNSGIQNQNTNGPPDKPSGEAPNGGGDSNGEDPDEPGIIETITGCILSPIGCIQGEL